MDFQRARSDEQRDQRRRTILSTAAVMLTEMPVAKLSLNELSRRVGLAKSNVLRYFDSREAVLLQLLDRELHEWTAELDQALSDTGGGARERGDRAAAVIARSLTGRPVMCDLISAQTAVLEHNISTEAALQHKRATAESVHVLIVALERMVPELGDGEAYEVVALGLFLISAAWPHSRPSEALLAAYAADPAVADTQLQFNDLVARGIALTISGLLARHPETGQESSP